MPMIPDDDLDKMKRSVDLAAVIRARGVELKAQGGDLVGRCPFHHPDEHPSLRVTPAKGLWRCMSSACGATGNVIQFVQRFDGLSFRHAFELLKNGAAFTGAPTCAPVKKGTVPRLPAPVAVDADDQAALRQVLDYYHERLKENPAALGYLKKRGITAEAVAAFRIGFVDRTLGLRLPHNNRKEGAAIRERLTRLGILRGTGHEHLRGRVVFPVIGENGEIGTVYGRAIDDGGKHDRHLFLPGPQRGLWNPAALRSPEVILTEGIIDALSFWCAGFKYVTTGYSAKALSEEMLGALLAAKVQRVLIAFDRDDAGEKGAAEVAEQLMARGVECRRVLFPHGHDANSYSVTVTPPEKSLGVLLNASAWLGRGVAPAPEMPAAFPLRGALAAMSKTEVSSRTAPAPSSLAAKAAAAAAPVTPAPEEKRAPIEAAREKTDVPATTVRHEMPTASPGAGSLTLQGEHWFLVIDGREYRVGGLEKTLGTEALKIALRLKVGERFHLDSLDLAKDSERRRFIERAAEETGLHVDLLKRDVGRLLLALEQAQAELARSAEEVAPVVMLSEAERAEALEWLRAPDLIGRLRAAFRNAGIIGEENNTLVAYLAGVSRLLDRPLAIIVQSASAAGKTTLMDAVLAFFPEEERVKYSAMTGQSLYYLGETNLKHKILAIVEEAGAEKASYALKLLQSEGELTIASTGKDPQTGRMETQEYHVEGPVMIILTTTAIDLDEELQNRCLTLAVDESPEQTARIHALQRERRTLAGLVAKAQRTELLRVLKNAQRLLAPVEVLNPFAPSLTFPSGRTRNRRDHEKYLTLIDAIALLHQHQRARGRHEVAGQGIEYVEATIEDIALANELAPEVLGRSLDELPPQTRRLLDHIRALVRSRSTDTSAKLAATFSRRELREACGWSLTQVRVHLERLVELEYLELRHGRLGSSFVYELMIDAEAPQHVAHIGLIDVGELKKKYDYGREVAGFKPRVAAQMPEVAAGGETPPPPSKPRSSEGETAA
jgi:DNA primase catalytic core